MQEHSTKPKRVTNKGGISEYTQINSGYSQNLRKEDIVYKGKKEKKLF